MPEQTEIGSSRIGKIEDNIFILHDKIEELSNAVILQKTMIDELFQHLTKMSLNDVD